MNELIKITEKDGKNVVSARELYLKLSGENNLLSNVTAWMTRNIERNTFAINNIDYQIIRYRNEFNREIEDYALSIDFAKELCMLSQCEKGKEIRLYFIEMEKKTISLTLPDFNNPIIAARAWADAMEKKQLSENKVKELEPKAEVYDSISNCNNLKTVSEVAKLIGSGERRLFRFMRENHIVMPSPSTIPYQRFIEAGYFKVKTNPIKGTDHNYTQSFFTSKGELWITDVFNKCHKAKINQ